MICTRGLGAGYGALPVFGMGAGVASVSVSAGSRGRRLYRLIFVAPSIESPIGAWRRERDDEELLLLNG